MLEQHLFEARTEAEQSDPPVKAAALLHLARIWAVIDRPEAERLLETGITLAFEIPLPDGDALRSQSAALAATVSPQRAVQLMPFLKEPFRATTIIANMLSHGYLADAVSWLRNPTSDEQYPYRQAMEAISRSGNHSGNEESRRNILRAAVRARLCASGSSAPGFDILLASEWSLLPAEEAKAAVRNIVQRIVEEADGPTQSKFSNSDSGRVALFSSTRESHLFGVFSVLVQLDVELADALCCEYPQLAAAIVAFPHGYFAEFATGRPRNPPRESLPPNAGPDAQPDYITVGCSRLLPIPEALRTEFAASFDEALRLYALDTDSDNPNQAPRECWPSAREFRNILFKAGEHEGVAALRYLNRISDRDLRLLARIELLAAIAGLPQLGGVTMPPQSRPRFLPMEKKDRWLM